jgi:hypothetical protein
VSIGPGSQLPDIARIYDALLGGRHNFGPDRVAADKLERAVPGTRRAARDNREFLGRTVDFLAGEAGITQFLDIGSGLPAEGQVHEIAQAANAACRVVYADNDPTVVDYSQRLLAGAPLVAVAEGDVRYPGHLLTSRPVRGLLDFSQPVAVLMVAVLHFVPDDQGPWNRVLEFTRHLAPGSFLVVSHVTGDQIPGSAVREAEEVFNGALVRGTARSKSEIARFFHGMDMADPGLVNVAAWRPGHEAAVTPGGPVLFWAGVARKPLPGRGEAPGRVTGLPAGDREGGSGFLA